MKPDIWFNGDLVSYEEANVHVLSHVLHYGSSVFEGIRCYETDKGSAVFRLGPHMRRLVDSAKIYRMEIPYDQDELKAATVQTIQNSGLEECYIRPLVFRGMGPMGVNPLQNSVETVIAVWEWGTYLGEEALQEGVDVEVANWNRMAPNTHPAMAKAGGNYLNASLVKMNAVQNGKMEGIMLSTGGYLAEGSGENLFVVHGGKLYTAPTGLSILPGITRDAIITLARERGYEIVEKRLPREVLYIARALLHRHRRRGHAHPLGGQLHDWRRHPRPHHEGTAGRLLRHRAPRQRPARLAHLRGHGGCARGRRRRGNRYGLNGRFTLSDATEARRIPPSRLACLWTRGRLQHCSSESMNEPGAIESIARLLVVGGLALAAVGGLLWGLSRFVPLGQLPGDISWSGENTRVFIPLARCWFSASCSPSC